MSASIKTGKLYRVVKPYPHPGQESWPAFHGLVPGVVFMIVKTRKITRDQTYEIEEIYHIMILSPDGRKKHLQTTAGLFDECFERVVTG